MLELVQMVWDLVKYFCENEVLDQEKGTVFPILGERVLSWPNVRSDCLILRSAS